MPRKQNPETPEEQSARFERDAAKLIEAGELSPIEGEAALDRLVRKQRVSRPSENG